ncbi:hypothetical protein BDZ91DRAFT_720413 [Kalaharituber pfeilii]|nr:hypothetical protein BDZ91DRAFT_720413 [Kalaharituber pfeilii]
MYKSAFSFSFSFFFFFPLSSYLMSMYLSVFKFGETQIRFGSIEFIFLYLGSSTFAKLWGLGLDIPG